MENSETETDINEYVDPYIEMLKKSEAIRTPQVERAFRKVPRHKLLESIYMSSKDFSSRSGYQQIENDPQDPKPENLGLIYSHRALLTRIGANGRPTSSTSMPGLIGDMLELMNLEPGLKVLEIGAGTGYNAALISEIVGDQSNVVSVDIQEDVVEQSKRLLEAAGYGDIKIIAKDGFFGVAEEAPFDRIVATVGLYDVSPHWVEQLAENGQMLLPIYQGGACPLIRLTKDGNRLKGRALSASGFMSIQGEMVPEAARPLPQLEKVDEAKIQRKPGWDFKKGMNGRWDFFFFLTASDPRASLLSVPGTDDSDGWKYWSFGIKERDAAAIIGTDEMVLVGEAEPLLERLEEFHELWHASGRPKASDYEVEFIPREEFELGPGVLAIERKYHWQVMQVVQPDRESFK